MRMRSKMRSSGKKHVQLEDLVELGRPVVALGLCRVFPLLVGEMWPNEIDLDEGPEHTAGQHPLQVVGSDN